VISPIPWTVHEIGEALEIDPGTGIPDLIFTGVSTDSRAIDAHGLFLALEGEKFDGHTFIADLVKRGVKGFVVGTSFMFTLSKTLKELSDSKGCIFFPVENTLAALGALARYQRIRANVKVVAITGSNGKTSTRKMTGEIFSKKFKTLTTEGNLNNEIGLPLTLLKLSNEHEWAVVEMGMNHKGEIKRLARIALPDIGVVTNTAECHLEGLGSVENVAFAKAELFSGMAFNGTAVLNHDDPRFEILLAAAESNNNIKKILCFTISGANKDCIMAEAITHLKHGTGFSLFSHTGESCDVLLHTPAGFMVNNALAAAAAAIAAGIPMEIIKQGLGAFEPVPGRMHLIQGFNNTTLIDDTYNANPGSVKAALETLSMVAGTAATVAVLGDMLELGERSPELHREIGKIAACSGISRLYVHGAMASHLIDGAVGAGFPVAMAMAGSRKEIAAAVMENTPENAWILVKGSRGMQLEKIIKELEFTHPL